MKKNKNLKISNKTKKEAATFFESIHHGHKPTFSQKAADNISDLVGSWKFIILQTLFIILWISLNVFAWMHHWDKYPFILLNLSLGIISTYTAPIIMMSQNRAEERDRRKAEMDFYTNRKAEREIEQIQAQLKNLEAKKIDKIIKILENK